MATSPTYYPLEPSLSQALTPDGKPLSFSGGGAADLFTSTSFLYSLFIMICVVAAGIMYARAGVYRMEASERGVRKSNEEIRRVTIGLLGVLSLFVIIYTFNKDLLTGNVKLEGIQARSGGGDYAGGGASGSFGGSSSNGGSGSTQSASCADPKTVIASLSSQNGVCGGTSCSSLAGCSYSQYQPIIESKAREAGVPTSMVIAIMCKESKGDVKAQHANADGTFDCGLMQVNQKTPCDQTSLDPATNIAKGIQKLKGAIGAASQVYPNIPKELGAFASYNCCSNGTVPNAESADCTQASGFPFTIPKWACPINPGTSASNMCTVKSYACDVYACMQSLNGM